MYLCFQFSAKMFNTIYTGVQPIVAKKYSSKLQIIFRQQVQVFPSHLAIPSLLTPQIQPWHPSSTLTHEAAAAVLKLDSSKFWPFSAALFADQKSYFDVNVVNETRNQTYARLAKLAGSVGVDESKVLQLLTVSDKPGEDGSLNIGNGVTNDVKLMVKVSEPEVF
jgi:hypothetical protein